MTVQELLEFVPSTKRIFIKPSGRRTYYEGTVEDAPESLMDAVVEEISSKPCGDDASELGIWVERNEIWNLMVDGIPDVKEFSDIADHWYWQIREYPEIYRTDVIEGIAKNHAARWFRYYVKDGEAPPTEEQVRAWHKKWQQEDEAEDEQDRLAYEEAMAEYIRSGEKSTTVAEFWEELGLDEE